MILTVFWNHLFIIIQIGNYLPAWVGWICVTSMKILTMILEPWYAIIGWKICLSRQYLFTFFKGCLLQILLGPFLNTLTHVHFYLPLVWEMNHHSENCYCTKYFAKTLNVLLHNGRKVYTVVFCFFSAI